MQNVVVVGASLNEKRYSNKAMKMLAEYGHNAIPVATARDVILGKKVYANISDIVESVDTVTLYIGPKRQEGMFEELIALNPKRVIFNPGTENPTKYNQLSNAGIEVVEACTLVMLKIKNF